MSQIRSMELFKVAPRWLFLKMTTDDGLVGWGEPIVEGRADTVAAAVEELSDYLIGKDPSPIEDLWQTLYRGGFYRGGPILSSAISGIEQALWDIKGKRFGVPVYELLGGPVREKVRVYGHGGGGTPAEAAASARSLVEKGFNAIKTNALDETEFIDSPYKIDAVVERLAAMREAVGSGVDIAVDCHGRVHKPTARMLAKALEPFKLLFLEEPVLPENNEALLEIRQACATPIATGERMFTRWGFKAALASGAVDVIQPDISHAGGIWETRKIAAMAEAYDVAVAPHCPLGPITLAASLQLDFSTPNAVIQEQSLFIYDPTGSALLDYLVDPAVFQFANGYVPQLKAPGLGIEIDEAKVRAAAVTGHRWRSPLLRNTDGSLSEW